MKMKFAIIVIALCLATSALAQSTPEWRSWNQPVEPFRIVGNIYYVGASDIASYLHRHAEGGHPARRRLCRDCTDDPRQYSEAGIQGGRREVPAQQPRPFDHAAGLAQLKTMDGRAVCRQPRRWRADRPRRSRRSDVGRQIPVHALKPDRTIADGEAVTVGDAASSTASSVTSSATSSTTMTAHLTPGTPRAARHGRPTLSRMEKNSTWFFYPAV